MSIESCRMTLETMNGFFTKALEAFDESDSTFAPQPDMFTVAQQVAHSAHVIDWFLEGAFSPAGLAEDWQDQELKVRAITSLKAARQWHDDAVRRGLAKLDSIPEADWMQPIGGNIMAGAPRASIFEAILDHAAHHRGSLAVYARWAGKTPVMPYM